MRAAALLMIPINVMAQHGVGLEAGGSMAYMRLDFNNSAGSTTKTNIIGGVKIGAVGDLVLDKHFYLQSGLCFSMKGTNFTGTENDNTYVVTGKGSYHVNYLELPLTIVYKTGIQGKGRFFIGGGAYVAYGPTEKYSVHIKGYAIAAGGNVPVDTTHTETYSMGKDSWDVGAVAMLGFEWYNGIFVRGNYDIGVKNLTELANEVQKTRAVTLSVGYYFGKKRHVKVVEEPLVLPD